MELQIPITSFTIFSFNEAHIRANWGSILILFSHLIKDISGRTLTCNKYKIKLKSLFCVLFLVLYT